MSSARCTLPLFLALALGVVPAGRATAERDELSDAKDRLGIEAQRVEKRFTEGRAAAYKLIRSAPPRYVEAVEEVQTLLAMLRADTSLKPARRKQLIVTLEWDLGNFRTLVADRRRAAERSDDLPRAVRRDARRHDEDERVGRRDVTREAERILASRGRAVADLRGTRTRSADRFTRAAGSVEESAVPESRDYTLPKNWAELSKRRSPEAKLTAKEKAVLEALDKVISVEFKDARFSEVIEYLEKLTGQSILIDRKALEEAGVSYESTVSLRLRATTRSVLKRILADMGLAYVIKDEQIEVTSQARAREMTTTRVYYLGDLAAVVDIRLDPITSQVLMIQRVNEIIKMITSSVDPQSWKVNNPEAPGKIVFDPVRMVLVVQQTAEVHYELSKTFRR